MFKAIKIESFNDFRKRFSLIKREPFEVFFDNSRILQLFVPGFFYIKFSISEMVEILFALNKLRVKKEKAHGSASAINSIK